MFSNIDMASARTVVSTAASVAASAMVIRSVAHDLLPTELRHYLIQSIRHVFKSCSSEVVIMIEEHDGLAGNQIYKAAELYLGKKVSPDTDLYRITLPVNETKMSITMGRNQEIEDVFEGVRFRWRQVTREVETKHDNGHDTNVSQIRHFQLKFHKKHKDLVLQSYFSFIIKEGFNIQEARKTLKLYTLGQETFRGYSTGKTSWQSINLRHPATFDKLAMDSELKRSLMEDLDRFLQRKDYYWRVGKAWKRGYLLYGPPGTGKSSLIAAMANYLNFNIYDLEISSIYHDADLRRLMLATENYSILVVEDIDCSLDIKPDAEAALLQPTNSIMPRRAARSSQITLSGLLNFIDGLWSSCGDARIIVFTTNHKDKLDPALLRPGRMDRHIHMSYCTPCGFHTLASNYLGLGVSSHPLFPEIEELLKTTPVTPAEIGEQLLKGDDPDPTLQGLIEFLKEKNKESAEAQAIAPQEE